MEKYFYFLLVASITFFGCRAKTVKDYAIVIKPIGPNDVPRTTFHIALKRVNFKRENPFTDEILTDENSLQNVVSFVEDNRPDKINTKYDAGWGALEISEYRSNRLTMDYELSNKEESKIYLRALIESLTDKNSDSNLIKLIKEQGLSEIDD